MAPTVVPMASAMKALLRFFTLPSSSTMPARLDTPIRVPMVSNISMKRKVSTTIIISTVKILCHSNCQRMGSIEGGVDMIPLYWVTPRGIPTMVVTRMPMSREPVTFLTSMAAVIRMPKMPSSTAGSWRLPMVTNVASEEPTIPALFRPTKAMKSPMPGLMARRRISGMALTM